MKRTTAIIALVAGFVIGVAVGRMTAPVPSTPTATNTGTIVPTPSHDDPPPTTPAGCPVVHVVDGDTLDVSYTPPQVPVTERIRMLGIDTPERGQPGYSEATDALEAIVGNGPVRLQWDGDGPERGRYGRLLAWVVIDDKVANVELVRQGFARVLRKYPVERYNAELDAAEVEAKREGRGVWKKQ